MLRYILNRTGIRLLELLCAVLILTAILTAMPDMSILILGA